MSNAQSSEPAGWSLVASPLSSTRPDEITPAQKSALTVVPSAFHRGVDKSARNSHGHKRQLDKAYGNDDVIPWSRPLQDRSVIKITGFIDPQLAFTTSIAVPVYASFYWTVSQIANATDLVNVFDEYHIVEIEALLQPRVTEVTASASGQAPFASAVDIDDANAPTSIAQVGSYASSVESSGTMSQFHRWNPQYAVATYSGAFTSYSSARGWVDCGSPSVQHFGLKTAASVTAAAQGVELLSRMTVLFRGLH